MMMQAQRDGPSSGRMRAMSFWNDIWRYSKNSVKLFVLSVIFFIFTQGNQRGETWGKGGGRKFSSTLSINISELHIRVHATITPYNRPYTNGETIGWSQYGG
jgi:hypothetical protein